MDTINITKIHNQTFFVIIDGVQFHFRLHYFRELLYADVSVNGKLIAGSVRCVPNGWLIPTAYTLGTGNFRFETSDGRYPNADNFGDTCFLRHYTQSEIDNM